MQENRFTDSNSKENLVKFFKQYDDRKGTNLLEIFPEFIEFLGTDYK